VKLFNRLCTFAGIPIYYQDLTQSTEGEGRSWITRDPECVSISRSLLNKHRSQYGLKLQTLLVRCSRTTDGWEAVATEGEETVELHIYPQIVDYDITHSYGGLILI